VPLQWITADEFYGRAGDFRDGVAAASLWYVVEIPSNLTGWTRVLQVEPAGTVVASGRTLKHRRVVEGEPAARPHCKRRRKELRQAGIDLRRAIRCPKWV
jgi:SRSO17 transposase